MSLKVSMVINSHLQDLRYYSPSSPDFRYRMKMIQELLFQYPNTQKRISDSQLDKMWETIIQTIDND
jgi:hypothetical protein